MSILLDTCTGIRVQNDGAGDQPLRQGRLGALITTRGHGNYFEQTSRRNVFRAHSIVTNPVAFGTAIGTSTILWNGSQTVNAILLSVSFSVVTAANTTTSWAIGVTGNTGQTSAPTTTTAIDSTGNCYIGGQGSACTTYRVGTVTTAGGFFLPFGHVHTGAISTVGALPMFIDLGGAIVVPPNCWISIAPSVATSSVVLNIGITWEEVPIGT